jgi:hypothetical protein
MLTRQISAPVVSSPTHCEDDSDEPDMEPDVDDEDDNDMDQFQSVPAPSRQISVLSNYSTKDPSRQFSAMSNMSGLDWEQLGGSAFRRQQTDENWPMWIEPSRGDSEHKQASTPDWTTPSALAMQHARTPMCAWQPVAPAKTEAKVEAKMDDNVEQLPFRRKRESLIDLAKQEQGQPVGTQHTGSKFCCWCGGKCRPSFRFCVFCGNAIP